MALLEGPPVIAEDLLEGVLVDSLSVVCHGRWLYHTLPPGSPACPHCPVPLPGLWREENRGSTKRKFLYAPVSIDESIRACDKFLLVLSKTSVASQWVEQEVETALTRERQQDTTIVFPIQIDNTV